MKTKTGWDYTDTYWNSKGRYQAFVAKLNELIPEQGSVKPKALELFRRASNVYYDLYNNGLINRAAEVKGAFGFGARIHFEKWNRDYSAEFYAKVEDRMDQIILAAAAEQNIKL